jgi:hypothetical protein
VIPKIEIKSLSVSTLKNEHDSFVKYNIEASLDEVETRDDEVVLKFKLVLLSNPTNTKIVVEGLAKLHGDQAEINRHLSPDEKNIPLILNSTYQEIFPLFFIVSKSMQIPCPAYSLSQMSSPVNTSKNIPESLQEPEVESNEKATNKIEMNQQFDSSELLEMEPKVLEQIV